MELLRRVGRATSCVRRLPTHATGLIDHVVFAPLPAGGRTWWMSVRGLREYPIKLLVRNHNYVKKGYETDKEYSLGIELKPSEVKAIRDRNADLSAAFGEFYKHELFLHQLHVPVWRNGLIGRPEPTRVRKLLANRSELKRMEAFLMQKDAHLIPMRLEVGNTGWIKVIMAQCFRRNKVDNRKRDDERDAKRQLRDW